MSATITGEYTVLGNKRVYVGTLTLGSTTTTGAVAIPGFRKVDAAVLSPVSGSTANFSLHININSGASAVDGWLDITSAISGDVYSVLAFGS